MAKKKCTKSNRWRDTKTGRYTTAPRFHSGKQLRLRELMNDPKVSKADRGWLRNDLRHIKFGNKKGLRVPRNGRKSPGRKKGDRGYEMGHALDKPASQGFNNVESPSQFKNFADHKIETKISKQRGRY